MKSIIAAIILFPSIGFADNLFKNSDMNLSGAWRGDKSYIELDSNRVIQVKANANKTVSFYQSANTRKLKDVVLKFKYMTEDYKGRGLQLRGERFNGSGTFRNIEIVADGQWHDYTWQFSEIRGSQSVVFYFNIKDGEGTIYFDNITLEAKK